MQTENPSDPKSVQELMGESTLGAIVRKARILDKANHGLRDLLNKEIRDCTQVVNLKESRLILACNNSAAATYLRYQEETLLKKLNKMDGLPPIDRIECVVKP